MTPPPPPWYPYGDKVIYLVFVERRPCGYQKICGLIF